MNAALVDDLAKVRVDLNECQQLLSTWYGIGDMPSATDQDTHRAIEALMCAVATLSLAVARIAEVQP
jgi:hypothetical protein